MLLKFQEFLTSDNIYFWVNFGVLPFWLMLVAIPTSKVTKILLNSVILSLVFASTAVFLVYQSILLDEPFSEIFKLYLSLDNLYTIFSIESFLLIFWIHFISINLFVGSWMANDATKYNIPRSLMFISLILVYFMGPVGITFYWFIRIFYAKKLSFYD